jgi:hypothetical protein
VAEGRVEAGSPLGQLAAAYGFAPFTVAVAGSYFARLAARDADLLDKARARPRPARRGPACNLCARTHARTAPASPDMALAKLSSKQAPAQLLCQVPMRTRQRRPNAPRCAWRRGPRADARARAQARHCAAFSPLVTPAALPQREAPPLPAALGSAARFYGCHASAAAWLTATFLSCALLAAKVTQSCCSCRRALCLLC